MSLKEKIAARLKAKAAGVNLSKERIDAIVLRAEKGLTDESDDTAIDANLDTINELTPFKDIASLDDHQRAKDKKIADDKEAKRLADIAAGKAPEVELPTDAPEWMKTFMANQAAQTKAIQDQLAVFSGKEVTNTRKQTAAEKLKDAPEAFRNSVLADMDDINFRDDDHYNSFLERKAGEAALVIQDNSNAGLGGDAPARGMAGKPAAEKEVSAEMKQYQADRLAERAKPTV